MRTILIFGVLLALAVFVSAWHDVHIKRLGPVKDVSHVKYVHTIFMNHLDVGFDGINPTIGYASNVIKKYWEEYFPAAIATAQELTKRGGKERLVYTTHSFLVSLYLDCPQDLVAPLNITCPNATAQAALTASLQRGDIVYHAFPFNAEPETMDASLFSFGLEMTHLLDERLNLTKKIVMSQRDVPGMTQSVIPVLKENGIIAISVGVNGGSAPPALPDAFVWRNGEQQVLGMYHPGGYGGIEINDCVIVDGLEHALAFAFRGDNAGPPAADEVIQNFAQLQSEFPQAQILASTFDAFATQLATVQDQLPVFESEVGDTWIYGIQSDPYKVSMMRAIFRVRTQFITSEKASGRNPNADDRFFQFNRLLLKSTEHTWGLDVKTFLHDFANWTNADFNTARGGDNYKTMEQSWHEQRAYIYAAIAALGEHPLADKIRQEIRELQASTPSTDGFEKVNDFSTVFTAGQLKIQFDAKTGAVIMLNDAKTGDWASPQNPLGLLQYQTYSPDDVMNFLDSYLYFPVDEYWWAQADFGKPNCSLGHAESTLTQASLSEMWVAQRNHQHQFLLKLTFPVDLVKNYGAPAFAWVAVDIVDDQPMIFIDLKTFDKTATRLPEAVWFTFNPKVADSSSFLVNKLSQDVNPYNVVQNGSAHLHGLWKGLSYNDGKTSLHIDSLDCGLVSAGEPNAYPTPLEKPDFSQGWNFNLFNNLWGTNYIMWYPFVEEDANTRYRFVLSVN